MATNSPSLAHVGRLSAAALGRVLLETFFLGAAVLSYYLVRGSVVERVGEATARAVAIIRLEERLGIFWERDLQAWILASRTLMEAFNFIYIWLYFPAIVAGALWLYFFHHRRYVLLRNAFLISGGIGLVIFNLLPVAPPRLLPQWGFVDVTLVLNPGYYDMQPATFVNHYAAMPSLHLGWTLLLGIGLFWASRHWWGRLLGLALPTAMFLAIVTTGNHYILDGIAGGAVALLGLGLALALRHYGDRLRLCLRSQFVTEVLGCRRVSELKAASPDAQG